MIYRFADCELDAGLVELRRGGRAVHVEPQVFELLLTLAERAGEVVDKDTLVARVWRGFVVSDSTINARVSAARKAVGDDGARQAVIRTAQRRGFALVAEVSHVAKGQAEGASGRAKEARLHPEIRYATSADGTAIGWTAEGAGPDLVRIGHWLTHLELDHDSPVFGPAIARLSGRHRLIRYDVRGTGLSDRGAGFSGLHDFVDDLDAVISAACTGPVDVFAASQAVPVAVAYAVRRPERVKRMVLYGGFVRGRTLRAGEAGDLDGDTALSMIRAGWGREGSVFMEAFIRMFAPDASPAMVAELARMQRETAEPDTVIRLRQTIDRFDVTDLLAQVVAPALVLHATGDVIQPFAQARALAAGLTDARLIPLDSRNHIALPDTQAWERLMAASEVFLAPDG
jgi:DNA-binding winged helix-turn-helix (wHTH) protein/pimeloyl-ACP methyl ester carboxylesterase